MLTAMGPMLLLAFLLPAAAPPPAAADAETDPVQVGRAAYAANRCTLCHSVAGKGNPKGPHDDVGRRLTADEMREWLRDPVAMAKKTGAARKPPMISYRDLPKEEIDALVAYLSTLKKPQP